ncbi:MAG: 16S rRNA (cytosine(1402)-N(4))-methyltransferase RsmH [Proteobacteria bacterium]|nr:16S rRNA (cytosine(1402)-N(4))-methyltransferase RsmH [Pseudomonadota bacterium]MBU1737046.1 16S rRNA (cytosine(1402)-N(4))-methyltransferase RsmH [Pseudomonadota bacterium]
MNKAPGQCHVPVLLDEVLEYLQPVSAGIYVDGNLGLGGHSAAILEQSSPDGRVIGFDWDSNALSMAEKRLAPYGERFCGFRKNFTEIGPVLEELGVSGVDGILLDLGLSSLQLDSEERGFSFKGEALLDMRMDDRHHETAADLLNTLTEEELADLFYYYGEERQARRIAGAVVNARVKTPFETTDQLVELVERAIPRRFHPPKIHVATKIFQALRIAVNRELDNLDTVLKLGPGFLRGGGRFCVISFHSLEDRMVKRAFNDDARLKVVTRKPVRPTEEECRQNPRSRSARFRVAEKLDP